MKQHRNNITKNKNKLNLNTKQNTSQSDYKASLKGTSAQHAAGSIKDEDRRGEDDEEFDKIFDKTMNSLSNK
jgi:hypothetical protein